MTATRKRWLILIVLVGAAMLAERVVSLLSETSEVVEPVSRTRPQRAAAAGEGARAVAAQAPRVQFDRLEARQQALDAAEERHNARAPAAMPFGSVSWAPPPPPAPPLAPPPKPVAPPFPYTYMGGALDDGLHTTFFNKGERVLTVKAGETIDGVYRVEQMSEKQMQLTYLPLGQAMTVSFGAAR